MQCSNCGYDLPAGVRFCPKCGTPNAPATAPVASAQPTVSFGAQTPAQPLSGGGMVGQKKKSGCGKAIIILLVIGLVLIGLAGGATYYAYRALGDKLRSSEAYTVAVSTLKNDPTVADKMGAITDTGFPLGAFHEDADGSGDAGYHLSVKGTKASGTYDVAMTRRSGKWYLQTGKVTLADGESFNVKSNSTPRFDPSNTNIGDTDEPPPPPPTPARGAGKRR
ncbi:MAG: zinc-ribbon domain [Acidobacteriota bacterium]|nr:zinc-ribbon domain [Acidobacteriota bacterium]